ncbi:Protein-L-isoaspartate O-methyltransferase [Alphaproteobacteria bacterium SO-S41]|nr:Protein-L-isoaspartate O-methyltransferase [Alphaproteobacteria bacterium SO-S41]
MSMTGYAAARANMVDCQIRTADVTDPELIAAIRIVPRELFVPKGRESLAYMGEAIDAGGRLLLDPRTFAKLAQLADPKPGDSVLDIGGGTGYSAAVLAHLTGTVVALEEDAALSQKAVEILAQTGAANVKAVTGKLAEGHAADAPYDVIFLNGSVPGRPDKLLAQLKPGGRLVGIVTDSGIGKAHIFVKASSGTSSRIAFDSSAAPLPGFAAAPSFVF